MSSNNSFKLFITALFFLFSISGFGQMRKVYSDLTSYNNFINKISFYSPSSGYVASSSNSNLGWLGYTTDSGRTFTKKYFGNNNVDFGNYTPNLFVGFACSGVKSFSQDTVIAYGDYFGEPAILRSTDGANSFKLVMYSQYSTQFAGGTISEVIFPQNGNIGYAIDNHKIYKTVNKGATWSSIRYEPINAFAILDYTDNIIYVTSYTSNNPSSFKIESSSNNGANWTPINTPTGALNSIKFYTSSKGWINLTDPNSSISRTYYTQNAGLNWKQMNNDLGSSAAVVKMNFVNDSTAYAFTESNTLYTTSKTTDSGKVWESLPRDNNFSYLGYSHRDIQVLNQNQLWSGGGKEFLEISTNGGGSTLPKSHFNVDTAGVSSSTIVKLWNYSKPNYQYKWLVNGIQVSTNYNATYNHIPNKISDTVKLITIKGGFTDTLEKYIFFGYPTTLTMTSFTPTAGNTGTVVTIRGYNFSGVNSIKFGNTPATSFTIVSSSEIKATVGSGSSGSITIANVNINATTSMPGFTYIPPIPYPPKITSFNPTSGGNGTVVTVLGENFLTPLTVKIGGVSQNYIIVNSNTLNVQVNNALSGNIVVTNKDGVDSMGTYTYYPVGTITNFFPKRTGVGNEVTITGTNFLTTTGVKIGGVPVTSFTIVNAQTIKVIIANNNTGQIQVTTLGGVANSADVFATTVNPVINSFSPLSGNVGSIVKLKGSNFSTTNPNNIVYFGNVKAQVINATSSEIEVSVPSGSNYTSITLTINGFTCYSDRPFITTYTGNHQITNTSFIDQINIFPQTNYDASLYFSNVDGADGVETGDFNGDGKTDIVTSNCYSKSMSIFINNSSNGKISFLPKVDIPIDFLPGDVEVVDFDSDGKLDLALENSNNYSVLLFKNNSTTTTILFDKVYKMSGIYQQSLFKFADIDGNGKPDCIVTQGRNYGVGSDQCTEFYRNLNFSINNNYYFDFKTINYYSPYNNPSNNCNSSGSGGPGFGLPSFFDMNGDGISDFVSKLKGLGANYPSDKSCVIYYDIDNNSKIKTLPQTFQEARHNYGVGDFNNDTTIDFVIERSNYKMFNNDLNYWYQNFNFSSPGISINPDITYDINGDGKLDLLSLGYSNGDYRLGIYKNKSTQAGNIEFDLPILKNLCTRPSDNIIADLNGDGKAEIITKNYAFENSVSIYVNRIGETIIATDINNTATIATSLSATTFQWQVNTDNGFVNISNGVNYSGTNTNSLQVLNTPYSFNGNYYRCLLNNNNFSDTTTLVVRNYIPVVGYATIKTTTPISCPNTTVRFTIDSTNLPQQFTPSNYQWQINGVNVSGANNNYFDTNLLNNNDQVRLITTINSNCFNNTTFTSNTITASISNSIPASVTIATPTASICAGDVIEFKATSINGGNSPTYQWQVNGINAGFNYSIFTSSTLTPNDVVKVQMTSGLSCASPSTVSSNSITMVQSTTTVTPSVTISMSQAINSCSSTSITFTATPVNGGSNPIYQWQVNGVNVWISQNTYTATNLRNGDQVKVLLKSNANCASPLNVSSNIITVSSIVNSVTPSVSITASATTICNGSSITFTATPTNGGSNPSYEWKINGTPIVATGNVFTTNNLPNNSQISVVMLSSANCASPTIATSNMIQIQITPTAVPTVSITTPKTTICTGASTIFTATPVNGGTSPNYQWQVNGVNVGVNSNTFTSTTLTNNSQVKVIMTSSLNCAVPSTATSNSILMSVVSTLASSVAISTPISSSCIGENVTFTATPNNGGLSPHYQWQVNGVNVGSNNNTFTTNTLANNSQVKVLLTNSEICASPITAQSNIVTMNVSSSFFPIVNISTTNQNICQGTFTTFTAAPTNGGANPIYQWQINGINVGTSNNLFTSSILNNGDIVKVKLTSSISCASPQTVNSNSITINVTNTISSTNNIAGNTVVNPNQTTTINSTSTNGGTNPTYQWQDSTAAHAWITINGATSGSINYTPITTGDKLRCIMTSNATCVNPPTATSNVLTFTVNTSTAIIPVAAANYGIHLYPNPVIKSFTIDTLKLTDKWSTIEIISIDGKSKIIETSIQNKTTITVDVDHLISGLYIAILRKKTGEKVFVKFVKD
jgi:hypothetical protein